jgi:hypothetical protein
MSSQVSGVDEDSDSVADAGSFAPPSVADPSAATTAALQTMRKFKGLLGDVTDHEKQLIIKRQQKELEQMIKKKGMQKLAQEKSARPKPPQSQMTSTSVGGTANWATQPGAAASGSDSKSLGNVVAGNLSVHRDSLLRVTMACSKWARIIKTVHGVNVTDPCELRLEMQRIYYPSLMQDVADITGGQYTFVPFGEPGGLVANVGYVNQRIQDEHSWMHKPYSGLPGADPVTGAPPPQPPQLALPPTLTATNVGALVEYTRQQKIKEIGFRAAFMTPEQLAEEEDEEGGDKGEKPIHDETKKIPKSMNPLGLNARASHNAPVPKLNQSSWGDWPTLTAEKDPPPPLNRPLWNGHQLPTMDETIREDLRMAKRATRMMVNKRIMIYAAEGRVHELEHLLLEGLSPKYEKKPWYLADTVVQSTDEANSSKKNETSDAATGTKSIFTGQKLYNFKSSKQTEDEEKVKAAEAAKKQKALVPKSITAQKLQEKIEKIRIRPNVNCTDAEGNTPLMLSVESQHVFAVALLMKLGADPLKCNTKGQCAVDWAHAAVKEAQRFYLIATKKMEAADRRRRATEILEMLNGRDLLHAAQTADFKRLRFLVEQQGENPTQVNSYGMTPLHFAVLRRDLEMMKYLSLHGADLYFRNNLGQSPWSLAMDVDTYEERVVLQKALEEGPKKFEEKHKKQKMIADAQAQEQAMLVSFQRRLKELTRGTKAAHAMLMATKDSRSVTVTKQPPTSGNAMDLIEGNPPPLGARQNKVTFNSEGEIIIMTGDGGPKGYVHDLYEESAKRHAMDFLAILRQEESQVQARGGPKGSRVPGTAQASRGGGPPGSPTKLMLAPIGSSVAEAHRAMKESAVPRPDDAKMDSWYRGSIRMTEAEAMGGEP